jgi:hypothetical protein
MMALKPCPECKAQISTGADVCPQCGFSFKKQARGRSQIGCAVFVVGFIALLGVIGSSPNDTKSKSEQTASSQGGAKEQRDKLPHIGDMAGLSMSVPGCLNEEATSKIESLLRENDTIAATKHAVQAGCVIVDDGKIGKVEHISVWNGNTCVRFQGEPECLWFPSVFVKSASELVASAISAQENEKRRAAESPECKKITTRLIKATGAQFERISPMGDNVFATGEFSQQYLSRARLVLRVLPEQADLVLSGALGRLLDPRRAW